MLLSFICIAYALLIRAGIVRHHHKMLRFNSDHLSYVIMSKPHQCNKHLSPSILEKVSGGRTFSFGGFSKDIII